MSETVPVVLSVDAAPLNEALSRLSEVAHLAPELVERVVDTPHLRSKLLSIVPSDDAARGAGDLRVRLKPSAFLLKLTAAVEALRGYTVRATSDGTRVVVGQVFVPKAAE